MLEEKDVFESVARFCVEVLRFSMGKKCEAITLRETGMRAVRFVSILNVKEMLMEEREGK